uniref:Aminotran_1_2 domain-containing protein n=1 Tax=Heterorhabditis bacteriophora TaxID=37862 RepID=A0A1I7XQC6_HETBA
MVTRARYLENEEQFSPTPSIRLMVQSELTNEEIERALLSITNIVHQLSA